MEERQNWHLVVEHFKGALRCIVGAILQRDRRTRGILVSFGFTLAGRGIALAMRQVGGPRALAGAGLVHAQGGL